MTPVALLPAAIPFRLLFVPGLLLSGLFVPSCVSGFVVGAAAYGFAPALPAPFIDGVVPVAEPSAPPAEPVPPPPPPPPVAANAMPAGAASKVAASVAFRIVLSIMSSLPEFAVPMRRSRNA